MLQAEAFDHAFGVISLGLTAERTHEPQEYRGIALAQPLDQVEHLEEADELFFTGTTGEVRPIVRVDGTPVGDGGVGTITQRLSEIFRARVQEVQDAAGAPVG